MFCSTAMLLAATKYYVRTAPRHPASDSRVRNKLRTRHRFDFSLKQIFFIAEKQPKIVSHPTHYTMLCLKPCATRLQGVYLPVSVSVYKFDFFLKESSGSKA